MQGSACPFPLIPFPVHTGTGELFLQGCALHGILNIIIFRTIWVQGEAHNKRCG